MWLVVIIAALITMSRHIPGSERSAWYASLFLTPEAILPGGRHFTLLPPVGKPPKGGPGVSARCLPARLWAAEPSPSPLCCILLSYVSRNQISGGMDEQGSSLPLQPVSLSLSAR